MASKKLTEIIRSFSYKLNIGNYQTADFFCSREVEVLEDKVVKTSEDLHKFCEDEVMKSVHDYKIRNGLMGKKIRVTKETIREAIKNAPASQADQREAEDMGRQKLKDEEIREANEASALASEGV